MNNKAFTLIELMVVIIIMGAIAAFSVPNVIRTIPATRLRSSADDLRGKLMIARVKAISEGVPYIAQFTGDGGGFTIIKDLNSNDAIDNGEPASNYIFERGITSDSIPTGSPSIVVFSPRGEATISGSIRLTNTRDEKARVHVVTSGSVLKQ
jgi:prepilin-type N-terminal cleavage/methylation domain-containing protein